MSDKKITAMVEKCESILQQIEEHAASIEKMHAHMSEMINYNNKQQNDLRAINQEEVQQRLIKVASKAAKKAAKKSITKARIREALKNQGSKKTG